MDFIEILKAVILGIIQGITEWLPISSTGHLILFDNIWPMTSTPEFFEVFKVVIQFGSILAVLVLFFHKLNPLSPKKSAAEKQETYTLWKKVAVGCIPIVIAGLPLDTVLEDYLSSVYIIAATLILYGIAFLVIESRKTADNGFSGGTYLSGSLFHRLFPGAGGNSRNFQKRRNHPGRCHSGLLPLCSQ